jgi:FkbM family methyltransferase
VIDFLGTRTRTSTLSVLPPEGGIVEEYPIPGNFHATAREWAGALRAVLAASTELVVVELGAGWGPWLISLAFAARQRGILKLRLVAVEGSEEHFAYLATHFRDNGLDPEEHTLLHGVVGEADGVADFPILADPAAAWGDAAIFANGSRSRLRQLCRTGYHLLRAAGRAWRKKAAKGPPLTRRVPCFSLATLLGPLPTVDLVHVDIQGHEYKVLASARKVLSARVKRIVIGTHGRAIEQQLLDELGSQGWILEADESCQYRQKGRLIFLYHDGCQVWRNPALLAA